MSKPHGTLVSAPPGITVTGEFALLDPAGEIVLLIEAAATDVGDRLQTALGREVILESFELATDIGTTGIPLAVVSSFRATE